MRAKNPTDTARKKTDATRKKAAAALASAISKPESHAEMTAVAVQAHT